MPDTTKINALLSANPQNEGEAADDYNARIAALGRAATVTDAASGPDTMVKLRTLDWLFPDGVQVKTIIDKWDGAITTLAAGDANQAALSAKLARTKGYMAGTGELDGIDVSDSGVRATVAAMVPDILTTEQAAAINALGTVTTYAVSPDLTAEQVAPVAAAKARADAWTALNDASYAIRTAQSDKLNWLQANPGTELPADLAGLDAFVVPTTEGDGL